MTNTPDTPTTDLTPFAARSTFVRIDAKPSTSLSVFAQRADAVLVGMTDCKARPGAVACMTASLTLAQARRFAECLLQSVAEAEAEQARLDAEGRTVVSIRRNGNVTPATYSVVDPSTGHVLAGTGTTKWEAACAIAQAFADAMGYVFDANA